MNDSNFLKVYYSSTKFVLNGIYLYIPLTIYQNNANMYIFNYDLNHKIIERLREIENDILVRVGITNKERDYCLYNKFISGKINVYSKKYENVFDKIVIKISGIWENSCSYGLNFKICV